MTTERETGGGQLGTPESVTRESPAGEGGTVFAPIRVDKPWGYELIWARTDEYVGKLLFVRAGEALSLQFHEEKDETLFLYSGEIRFEVGAGIHSLHPVPLGVGQAIRIVPGTLHRMEAVTDCTIFETSTTQLDDVVRLDDRYGRAPGPSSEAHDPDRA